MPARVVILDDDVAYAHLVASLVEASGYAVTYGSRRDSNLIRKLRPAVVIVLFHTTAHAGGAPDLALDETANNDIPVIVCATDRGGLRKARAFARRRPAIVVPSFDLDMLLGAIASVLPPRAGESDAA